MYLKSLQLHFKIDEQVQKVRLHTSLKKTKHTHEKLYTKNKHTI